MDLVKMAWRNVWRNRRRSGVTVAAMTLALFTMIVYAGLMEGMLRGMEQSILDYEVGDLQVFAADYRDDPSIYSRIEGEDRLLAELESAGLRAAPRLLAYGMAASGDASAGVSFRGIEVDRESRVSRVHEQVEQGDWLDPSDPKGVVIGRKLARTLAVALGEELLVVTQGADGAMAYELYRVRGILYGLGEATDRTGLFVIAEALRELLLVPSGVHQIVVRRAADVELDRAAALVRARVGDADARTWRELMPTLSTMLDSARAALVAVFLLVYIAIAILILNAMLMAVFERVRELGVLKAIGVGPGRVFALLAIEGGIQTALAVVAGVALAVPAVFWLERVGLDLAMLAGVSIMGVAMDPVWRAVVEPQVFARPVGVLVSIVAIAILYPATKAALIQPVAAIRHQ